MHPNTLASDFYNESNDSFNSFTSPLGLINSFVAISKYLKNPGVLNPFLLIAAFFIFSYNGSFIYLTFLTLSFYYESNFLS